MLTNRTDNLNFIIVFLCRGMRHLEGLEDPLEEDEVGIVNLRFLCDVLDFHLRSFLFLLFLLATALFLLLLCLFLLLLGALLLAPLLAVSTPAVFLTGGSG